MINFSEPIRIELLKIAHSLSKTKANSHDYTEQRVIATYWKLYELFEATQLGLENRVSSTLPDTSFPLSSNQEQ